MPSNPHRLEENVAAADVELTAGDLREIEEAVSKIEIQGARYPESSQGGWSTSKRKEIRHGVRPHVPKSSCNRWKNSVEIP